MSSPPIPTNQTQEIEEIKTRSSWSLEGLYIKNEGWQPFVKV